MRCGKRTLWAEGRLVQRYEICILRDIYVDNEFDVLQSPAQLLGPGVIVRKQWFCGVGEVAQTMYAQVSKCENDKGKEKKKVILTEVWEVNRLWVCRAS
jgi:hypothetical protein